ncbi:ATP-binding protein [Parasporobacterium paucivorans]|uniref:Replicative DNA helicase loader DnaI n=1 Tax=Parasporobacterium paucivorans DSM 15970 TaxID=1122934 RepID=A0A1M6CSB7_9FIRM|nr:ATP-binding protein [Parasporobacterium paucivorans]SHI63870.1 replicative DNA helicase loader DnaI [Parasporobacterium paucivorans DSM 15970]
MSLSKVQYDQIFRTYDQKRLNKQRELDLRKKEVYTRIPRLVEIDNQVAALSVAYAKQLLNGNAEDASSYKTAISSLGKEKAELIKSAGYSKDYLETDYYCRDCKDTGYIDSKKCHCFTQEIINILYDQSNIKEILKEENFDKFSFKYYSDTEANRITGTTPLKNIQKVVSICKNFIKNFGTVYDNLFFYGEAGTGKTFLCSCIAKELIERSYSVIYLSAIKLFELLSDATFRRGNDTDNAEYIMKHILTCDLLIIDDLGTELVNSFTSSGLFNCINERYLSKRPTIMSTNLSIEDLQKTYSERTFSRITSNYTMLKIFGDDIRVKKKLEG